MRISKAQWKRHDQVMQLLKKDILTPDDRLFVLENFHPGTVTEIGRNGAFFTPQSMASQFILNTFGYIHEGSKFRVIDLCAGIGSLSRALVDWFGSSVKFEIVCVEINSALVEVGKKLVPEATWHHHDVMDLDFIISLGQFDWAMSNPPYGANPLFKDKPGFFYQGSLAEYKVADIASVLANHIGLIVPQNSAGFKYSGVNTFEPIPNSNIPQLSKFTEIELSPGIPIDTRAYGIDQFEHTNITVEFVEAETHHIKLDLMSAAIAQQSMF